MAIRLGCMSNAFMFAPLEEALRGIAATGLKYVEIMCDRPHMYPDDYNKEDRARIRALCDSLGLTITGLDAIHVDPNSIGLTYWRDRPKRPHFFPDPNGIQPTFTAGSPEIRRARIDYVKKVIKMAADLGATKVDTVTGGTNVDPDDAYRWCLEGIREVCDYAAEKKILVTLEMPGIGGIFGTDDEMLELIHEIKSPWLKVCVDIGHLDWERYPIGDTIRKLGRHIGNFHVEDMKRHKHYHLVPGRGSIPWKETLDAIADIDYEEPLMLELYSCALDPVPALIESQEFFRNFKA